VIASSTYPLDMMAARRIRRRRRCHGKSAPNWGWLRSTRIVSPFHREVSRQVISLIAPGPPVPGPRRGRRPPPGRRTSLDAHAKVWT